MLIYIDIFQMTISIVHGMYGLTYGQGNKLLGKGNIRALLFPKLLLAQPIEFYN